jgi:hypothetical protein
MESMPRFNDRSAVASSAPPLTTTEAVSKVPTIDKKVKDPVASLSQDNSSNSLSSEKPTLVDEIQYRIPHVEPAVKNNGSTVSSSDVGVTQQPALLTPLSLYGKRIRYSILEYNPLLDSANMTMNDWYHQGPLSMNVHSVGSR